MKEEAKRHKEKIKRDKKHKELQEKLLANQK